MNISVTRTVLLTAGILLVVIGAGLVLEGHNQMEAADEWDSQVHDCGTVSSIDRAESVRCPRNPYEGGEGKVFWGILVAIIGGVTSKIGAE
jgi:hypothetical protein